MAGKTDGQTDKTTEIIKQARTNPCNSLDSSNNLEQQLPEIPGWEGCGRVLNTQTQQVGRCELMVVSYKRVSSSHTVQCKKKKKKNSFTLRDARLKLEKSLSEVKMP